MLRRTLVLGLGAVFCSQFLKINSAEAGTTGIASYYGRKFHGKRTASGKKFNMHGLTAAHRTLPFGTRVRVTHLRNKRSVVVTINDRGPFSKGRIIDLSKAAAAKIRMINSGTARVRIERI